MSNFAFLQREWQWRKRVYQPGKGGQIALLQAVRTSGLGKLHFDPRLRLGA